MASIHGKNALSFRKTRTSTGDTQSPTILQDYKFAHESVLGGETFIDLDALVTPTSINTGIINPVGGQLAAINLKNNSNSIVIISSDKGTLQQGSWQVSNSGRQINLAYETEPNEIFTVQVRTTQATANVVDADAFAITGTLLAGDVDIPLGQVFTLNANPTEQIGEVILTIDGVEQLRNVNNAVADPLADGNYQEVASGANQTNLLRLNQSFPVDVAYSVKANGLIVNAEPNNSHTQALESLGGQLDAIIPTVADLAGVDESDFQGAPNNVDLKAFSDRVYENKDNIATNTSNIAQNTSDIATKRDKVTPAAKMYTPGGQNINNASVDPRQFDGIIFNTQPGLVDLANNRFVIQEAGIYTIKFHCSFGNSGDFEKILNVYVNGVKRITNQGLGDGPRTDGRYVEFVDGHVDLQPGDLITFEIAQYSGAASTTGAAEQNGAASIVKVSDL
jgi:hypothetical protein